MLRVTLPSFSERKRRFYARRLKTRKWSIFFLSLSEKENIDTVTVDLYTLVCVLVRALPPILADVSFSTRRDTLIRNERAQRDDRRVRNFRL